MKQLKVGIVGLGRLGKEYAHNIAFKIRKVSLVAICSIVPEELEYAKSEFGIKQVFSDYDEMLVSTNLDAVFVISSTDKHVEHITKALEAGLHVFSEKPLAITLEACQVVENIAAKYPNQIATVGFVRRFDPSYQYAKEKVKAGAIGQPYLVRSQTVDMDSLAAFQIKYVGKSGGIFHDYNVHDIDLARWFLDSEIQKVWSIGGAYKYPAFAEAGDADNVMTTCLFDNNTMAIINASRTATHGHDTYTEIIGTEGTLRIGRPPGKNRVEVLDKYGVRKECLETFWDRFEEAFLRMTVDFIDCVLENRQPELTLADARQATKAAIAFTESFRNGSLVEL